MFSTLILCTILGGILGTITGLIPGIHVNLIAVVLFSISTYYAGNPFFFATIMISMAITHTFVDIIPAMIIGVPDPSLALLPQHTLVHEGRGYEAIKYTVLGSMGGLILATLMLPLFFLSFLLYDVFSFFIPFLLVGVLIITIITDHKWYWGIIIVGVTGFLGVILLESSIPEPLFLLFTGLFGASSVILAIVQNEILPLQILSQDIELPKKWLTRFSVGTIIAVLFTIIPGTGAAHAAFFVQKCTVESTKYTYLITIGCINTVNAFIAIVFLYAQEKSRTGIAVSLSSLFVLEFHHLIVFIVILFISAGYALIITLFLGKILLKIANKIPLRTLSTYTLILLIILTLILSGLYGVFILTICASIGILTILLQCKKSHIMACIIIPLLLSYL